MAPLGSSAQKMAQATALEKGIAQFDQLQDKASCIQLDQTFSQLCKDNPNQWLPYYYACLIKVKLAMYNDRQADLYADQAIVAIQKAKQLQLNDEVLCGESLAYSTKISIRPVWRWFAYEHKMKAPLMAAKKMNPNNPRVYVLEAMLQYKLPAALGGSCKSALPLAQKAILLLKQQTANQQPHWGMQSVMEIQKGCAF
jgi:hypothetical protein